MAIIDPERGCTRLSLQTADCLLEAELEEISTIEDQGIPQARISLKETY
ncbi:hypothetical protein [endosymbiont of Riftia pachyptila]|nr:hypothetical protein [endosymbiont of Riftia pachyptila]